MSIDSIAKNITGYHNCRTFVQTLTGVSNIEAQSEVKTPQVGDILWWGNQNKYTHVAVYAGDHKVWQVPEWGAAPEKKNLADVVKEWDQPRKYLKGGIMKKADLIPHGRADNQPDANFDSEELALGVKVEQEHTDNKDLAKEIAKDHLAEMPDYYTKLIEMEKKACGDSCGCGGECGCGGACGGSCGCKSPSAQLILIAKTAKRIASTIGVISKKELDERFPALSKAYQSVYGGRKPDIHVVSGDKFSFPAETYSMGSWHTVFAAYNDQVKQIPVEKYFGRSETLKPDSMILDCLTGNLNLCYLYIHPSNTAPLLKGDDDLTDEECLVLSIMMSYKPFAREQTYFDSKYTDGKYEHVGSDEYKRTLQSLKDKGLVKINAAGSAQLTLEGKNKAHSPKVKQIVSKFRGY